MLLCLLSCFQLVLPLIHFGASSLGNLAIHDGLSLPVSIHHQDIPHRHAQPAPYNSLLRLSSQLTLGCVRLTVNTNPHIEHSLNLRESLSKSVLLFRPAAVEFRIYGWPSRQA